MSTRAQGIEIVTVYSSPRARSTGSRIRLLGVISVIIAASWIDTLDGTIADTSGVNISITKLIGITEFQSGSGEWQDVADWLGVRIGMGSLSAATGTVGDNDAVAGLFGGAPKRKKPTAKEIEEIKKQHALVKQKIATLNVGREVWVWSNRLTGYWLGLTGLLTLLFGSRGTLRMHSIAGGLIILASILTVAGIWAAINFGGMPADASLPLYVKIGVTQSLYGWICLVAAKSLR